MNHDKTQLGIILAIQKASTDQLKALSRIEKVLGSEHKASGGAGLPNATPSEVTVSAKRRVRTQPTQNNVIVKISSKDIAKQLAKLAKPLEKSRARQIVRDSKGRFVSAAAVNQPVKSTRVSNANIEMNERIFQSESKTGEYRARTVNQRAKAGSITNNVVSIGSAVEKLNDEIIRLDKNGRQRDKNGRFLSKEKVDEIKAKRSKNGITADATLQDDFLKRLGSALTDHGNGKFDAGAGDMAGTAAGGVMWHMARGAWDIASTAKDNAVSMNDWRKKHFGGEGKVRPDDTAGHVQTDNTRGNLALKPAIAYPAVNPLNAPQKATGTSKEIFEGNAKREQVKATERQTATLSAKDDVIIKNQEEELDLLKKIARNGAANDGLERFGKGLFKKLFGRRGRKSRFRESRRDRKARIKGEKKRVRSGRIDTRDHNASGKENSRRTTVEKGRTNRVSESSPAKSTEKIGSTKSTPKGKAARINMAEKAAKPAFKEGGKVVMQTEKMAFSGGVGAKAANDVLGTSEKIGGKTLVKGALKAGTSIAAKTALKAVPLIGTAAATAWDAVDGYNDTEGQQKAFNLKEGQEATKRQKTEMAGANIVGLGGLIPLASQGLSWGANKLGMTDKTDALDIDTSDIASGIDKSVSAVGSVATSAFSAVKGLFTSSTSDDKAAKTQQNQQISAITTSVKQGSDATVNAIDRLSKQLEGGKFGEDGVGAQGTQAADYKAPTANTISMGPNGLNIGGTHAANRSFRNNNFGNLNFANQEGAVLEATPGKGKARFAQFATPEDGFRALANQVSSYANGTSKAAGYQKLNTVQDIISKWAPPNENNTAKYIQTISANLGVKPTDKVNTSDPKVMVKLMRAIATYEGGNPTVNDDYLQNAIGYEDATTHRWVGGSYSKESQEYMAKNGIKPGKGTIKANATQTATAATAEAITSAPLPALASPTATPSNGNDQAKVDNAAKSKITKAKNAVTAKGAEYGKQIADASKALSESGTQQEKDSETTENVPSSNTLGSKVTAIAGIMTKAATGNWFDKGAKYSAEADAKLTAQMQKLSGGHIGFRRATSGLTLPGNMSESQVPEGLRAAMGTPAQIAKQQAPNLSVTDYGNVQTSVSGEAQQQLAAVLPKSIISGKATQLGSANAQARVGLKTTAAAPRNQPEKNEGFLSSVGGFFSDIGSSAMKAAPGILSTIGDVAMPAAQGFLSNVVGDLGSQIGSGIQSPLLSSLASPFIQKGVSSAQNIIQSPQQVTSMFSMPQVLPEVTNLARSGSNNAMQQITAQLPDELGKGIMQLVELTKRLVSGQKEYQSEARPDVVTHGGQKPPKHDDQFNDPALNALLGD